MRWPFGRDKKKVCQVVGNDEDFLLVTWDSCRFDAMVKANTPALSQFGEPRRGWAMATYTLPAHVAMFQGFLPHVYEPEPLYNRYCQQLWRISHRNLNVTPLVTFPSRTRSVIWGMKERGYCTVGAGAMDWFRDAPVLQEGFEQFAYTGTAARKQNRFLIDHAWKKASSRPLFMFINYGETHSPFRYEGMPEADPDVEKRFSRRRLYNQQGVLQDNWEFDEAAFQKQVACAEFLDARTGELLDFFRERGRPTTVVICGDHGECFGENGMYGHAFYHEKVMEVPMLIFRLNAPPHSLPRPMDKAA